MTCQHVGSGCNAPEGECLGFCLNKGYEVQYKNGTKLTDRESGAVFVVSGSNAEETQYQGASGRGTVMTDHVAALFEVDGEPMPTVAEALSALDGRKHSHYFKDVSHLETVDVYRVLDLFGVTDQAVGHAVKKLLCAGQRGSKDARRDIQEAVDTLSRRIEMYAEDSQ